MADQGDLSAKIAAIILAAGKGTRMKSRTPKVLHQVCGTPMLERIVKTLRQAQIRDICLVLGDEAEAFDQLMDRYSPITAVIQHHKLGTGDAVAATACGFAKETFPEYSRGHLYRGTELSAPYVIICAGDTPALDPKMIQDFLTTCHRQKVRIGVIGMRHPYPTGYGRLVVDEQQRLSQIVEEKDASSQIKAITLCNSGVVFAERAFLFELLKQLDSNNAQNEYYLTDCFQIASRMGESALVFETDHYQSFAGVNRRDQLAEVERFLIQEKVSNLMSEGVSFHLPETCYLEDDVKIGCDSEIGANCSLLGKTLIGLDCRIGANSVLQNVSIPDGTILPPGTISIKE